MSHHLEAKRDLHTLYITGAWHTTYISGGEPMARVPKVARETILRGTRRTLEIKEFFLIFYFHTTFTKNRTIRHFEISAHIFLVI